MDVIVIGPGLGQSHQTVELVHKIITTCKDLKKPVVIDADGLYAVSIKLSVLNDYPNPGVILTPNHREADYLRKAMKSQNNTWGHHITILVKGEADKFYLNNLDSLRWTLSGGGSGRRAAGQGDILSGTLGTLLNWAIKANFSSCSGDVPDPNSIASISTYSAAKLTRLCNANGFSQYGRSMTASDMLKEIHPAFEELFGK